jgi:hypothetical protein
LLPRDNNNNTITHNQSNASKYDVVDAKLARFFKQSSLMQTHTELIDLKLINQDITGASTISYWNPLVATHTKGYWTTKHFCDGSLLVGYNKDCEE